MKNTNRAIIYTLAPTALVDGVSQGLYHCYEVGKDESTVFADILYLALHLNENHLVPEPIPSEEGWPNDWKFIDAESWAYLLTLM